MLTFTYTFIVTYSRIYYIYIYIYEMHFYQLHIYHCIMIMILAGLAAGDGMLVIKEKHKNPIT